MHKRLFDYFPLMGWLKNYHASTFAADLLAAGVVIVVLIPQSLAYALLAGLPPETGLYASIIPIVAYSIFGSSRYLAVGPVAIISLMTAVAIKGISVEHDVTPIEVAVVLSILSGGVLLVMGILRMGAVANFISYPVILGFVTSAVIIIACNQLSIMLGAHSSGETFVEFVISLPGMPHKINTPTVIVSIAALCALVFTKYYLAKLMAVCGISKRCIDILSRTGPIWAMFVSIVLVFIFDYSMNDVQTLEGIPLGLPVFTVPSFNLQLWRDLILSALLIGLICFVESVSVAQILAAKEHQKIYPNRELFGLGFANIFSGLSGAFPVAGGLSRSIVNYEARVQTPLAGIFTAIGVGFSALYLAELFNWLPKATLAAITIMAVLSLIDLKALIKVWNYSKSDFVAMVCTMCVSLILGIEYGIVVGVVLSVVFYLQHTSKPHIAIVGRIPGTEHFRNRERHDVLLDSQVLSIRIDENLYFANTRYLEEFVFAKVAECSSLTDVVLQCSAVNYVDSSALLNLEMINRRLKAIGVLLHLAEVKGPVMDTLIRVGFNSTLTGNVFLTQYQAINILTANRHH